MRFRPGVGTSEDQPFWRQRGWVLSAGFLGLLLLAGATAAIVGLPEADVVDTSHAGTGPLTTPLPSGMTRPAGCSTDDHDQQPPTEPPADIMWHLLNGANIPISATAGPVRQFGTILWCFAHTPMGAAMAVNIIPRHMSGDDWRTAADQQIVAGVQRDVFEARRASITTTKSQYTANSPAGFMVVSYSPEEATIRLLIRQSAAAYVVTDLTVVWDNGDWKLMPLSGGQLYTPVTQASAAAGFVMWKV